MSELPAWAQSAEPIVREEKKKPTIGEARRAGREKISGALNSLKQRISEGGKLFANMGKSAGEAGLALGKGAGEMSLNAAALIIEHKQVAEAVKAWHTNLEKKRSQWRKDFREIRNAKDQALLTKTKEGIDVVKASVLQKRAEIVAFGKEVVTFIPRMREAHKRVQEERANQVRLSEIHERLAGIQNDRVGLVQEEQRLLMEIQQRTGAKVELKKEVISHLRSAQA